MARSNQQRSAAARISASLVGKVVYPLWTMRDHPAYLRFRKSFERSQFYGAEQLRDLQLTLLRQSLQHAYRTVPFYKQRMDGASFRADDLRSLEDFRSFPVLTKSDIQENKDAMLARDVPESKRQLNYTGGSTGRPLQFWVDKQRFDARRASTDRHDAWAGLKPGEWRAVLWGARADLGNDVVPRIDWRQRLLHRTVSMNSGLTSEASLEEFVRRIRRYRPRFLVAYAQAADMFARYCKDRGFADLRFEAVITSAEVLGPEARARIEESLGPVFNRYGCREVSVIASECERHEGMHVNADALLVELEPIPGGQNGMGKVLVTDLYNRSMPLLRYEIGDLAAWAPGDICACGRSLPRIARVEGRITDFLKRPDGTLISGPTLTLPLAQIAEVKQAQFVQTSPRRVQLRVVVRDGFSGETEAEIGRRLQPFFLDQLELEISRVESIASEASGKYRFIKFETAE